MGTCTLLYYIVSYLCPCAKKQSLLFSGLCYGFLAGLVGSQCILEVKEIGTCARVSWALLLLFVCLVFGCCLSRLSRRDKHCSCFLPSSVVPACTGTAVFIFCASLAFCVEWAHAVRVNSELHLVLSAAVFSVLLLGPLRLDAGKLR